MAASGPWIEVFLLNDNFLFSPMHVSSTDPIYFNHLLIKDGAFVLLREVTFLEISGRSKHCMVQENVDSFYD